MRLFVLLSLLLLSASASAKESPYIDLTGIEGERLQLFEDITSERLSPCGDPETLAEAFTKEPPCLLAVSYGRILARLFRSGFARDHIDKFLNRVEDNNKKPLAELDVTERPARGPAAAPVTIVEFADYECPYCGRLEPILQRVLAKHPEKVKHYFLNFPLTQLHPKADAAARAAIAAKRQGKFWEMHDLLYERQEQLDPEKFNDWAKELGLNVEQFQRDMTSPEVAAELADDIDQATKGLRLDGTPTLYFNGRRYIEALSEEALENAVLLAYAQATGDTSSFLIDPGATVRAARAEMASFLLLLVLGIQASLLALSLAISSRRQAKHALPHKTRNIFIISGVFIALGLTADLVVERYLTGRFGPGDPALDLWLLSALACLIVATLFLLPIRKKSD